ncbi:hypothetical protein [Campylobacter lanienae]|nr:hypothetical protein [Campylobacter lanienae]
MGLKFVWLAVVGVMVGCAVKVMGLCVVVAVWLYRRGGCAVGF